MYILDASSAHFTTLYSLGFHPISIILSDLKIENKKTKKATAQKRLATISRGGDHSQWLSFSLSPCVSCARH